MLNVVVTLRRTPDEIRSYLQQRGISTDGKSDYDVTKFAMKIFLRPLGFVIPNGLDHKAFTTWLKNGS